MALRIDIEDVMGGYGNAVLFESDGTRIGEVNWNEFYNLVLTESERMQHVHGRHSFTLSKKREAIMRGLLK